MIRRPVVAGKFYPSAADELERQIGGYMTPGAEKRRVIGIVSPHAGYVYSGRVAGDVYSRIVPGSSFIIMGPNHTGMGLPVSVYSDGEWEVPNGIVEVDSSLASLIMRRCGFAHDDYSAHLYEHSLEVQIPFIKFLVRDPKIVPVVMMEDDIEVLRDLGEAVADAVASSSGTIIIASTDMTHYESDESVRRKDSMAIRSILDLDPLGLYEVVRKEGISMCGFAPTVSLLFAANRLGAKKAELVRYATSAEVSGDYSHVVGYAGILIMQDKGVS